MTVPANPPRGGRLRLIGSRIFPRLCTYTRHSARHQGSSGVSSFDARKAERVSLSLIPSAAKEGNHSQILLI